MVLKLLLTLTVTSSHFAFFLLTDTPFRQQRVKSFLPILQPVLVVGIFLAIGVVFIPLGKWFIDESKSVRHLLPRRPLTSLETASVLQLDWHR